jgi:hypothetical protein
MLRPALPPRRGPLPPCRPHRPPTCRAGSHLRALHSADAIPLLNGSPPPVQGERTERVGWVWVFLGRDSEGMREKKRWNFLGRVLLNR